MFATIGWSKVRTGGWEYEKLARDEGVFYIHLGTRWP